MKTVSLKNNFFRLEYQKKPVGISEIGFAVLLALVSTVLSYQFAVGNQLEQLPIIMRQLDPTYLTNDFFLATTEEFGPRTYFIGFLGIICQFVSIPWAYAILTFLSDLALVGVTLWTARTVINSNRLGAAIAAVMTLGLASFHVGDATQIRYEIFQPASLAIPVALAAITFGLRGRPVAAALTALLASLPHPLYGAEGGGIALGIAFFALLIPVNQSKSAVFTGSLNWGLAIRKTLIGCVIFGVGLVVFWWLPNQNINSGAKLSTEEFYNILARFRAPHHYFPSYFRVKDYLVSVFFLVAMFFAFDHWAKTATRRSLFLLLIPVFIVFIACLVAYVFTEIWPLRSILTLQLFRLLSIVKWIGFLLFGSILSTYLLKPTTALGRPLALLSLFSTGVTQPIVMSMSLLMTRLQPWRWIGMNQTWCLILLSTAIFLMWMFFSSVSELIYLLFAWTLLLIFVFGTKMTQTVISTIILILILSISINRESESLSGFAPQFDFNDQSGSLVKTAWAIDKVIPKDALLLAPPQFGLLRIIGGRALVVDFKSIPFQDQAMLEWRERMQVVYGDVEGGGFKAVKKLDSAYRMISDNKLLDLAKRYRATHALLYADTLTALPEIYVDNIYRLVRLSTD